MPDVPAPSAGGGPVKQCTRCRELKPVEGFHLNRLRADGLATWCRVCVLDYSAEYRDRPGHRERARAYAAEWRKRRKDNG